jgi:hypothetical protein
VKNKLTKEPFTPTSQNWTAKIIFIWQKKKLYRNLKNAFKRFYHDQSTLRIKDVAYERFMNVLKEFKNDEVKIVSDDSHFEKSKAYIKEQLEEIDEGKAKFYTQEEFENIMNEECSEVKIVSDDYFEKSKAYLKEQFEDMRSGKARFYSIEEVEASLDEIISKYENNPK